MPEPTARVARAPRALPRGGRGRSRCRSRPRARPFRWTSRAQGSEAARRRRELRAPAAGVHPLCREVASEDEESRADLGGDPLPGREDAEPEPGPVRKPEVADRVHRQPAHDLADLDGLPGHDHEHAEDQEAGQLEHPPVRKLALELNRQHADGRHADRSESRAFDHVRHAGVEDERLEEEHRLEALAVDAREAEQGEAGELGGRDGEPGAAQDALLLPVQARQVVAPVHAVEEPVQDEEQHRDGDQGDDRLELLAVADERGRDRLRDHEGDDGGEERGRGAEEERPAKAPLRPDQPGGQSGEDQHGLEPLAEDDDRRVRDDGEASSPARRRPQPPSRRAPRRAPRATRRPPRPGPCGG